MCAWCGLILFGFYLKTQGDVMTSWLESRRDDNCVLETGGPSPMPGQSVASGIVVILSGRRR